jgi:23S rRNA (uracil1939-C5)-methyltransferase
VQIGQEIELEIERLGIHGEGVGHVDGFTLFVEGALPGETVHVRLHELRKTFGRATIIHFLKTSLQRAHPPCPLFGRCGGCHLMHLNYEEQLEVKRQRVRDALERIGKLFDVEILPCAPSPLPLGYRNKIQLPVKEGSRLGLYARQTHDIIALDECLIHCDLGEKALQKIQEILKNSPCHELKHLLIKTAVKTGQILIILVTGRAEFSAKIARRILEALPEIKGVVQNINPREDNVILGEQFQLLAGQGWIEEEIEGLMFKVSPASFFQVNPLQAEQLYQKVAAFANLSKEKSVLDAYCGVGTLSLILAKQAKTVIGFECVAPAIADAKENAVRNRIDNCTFVCGRAEELIAELKQIDVAVLNPPRKGCEPELLTQLIALHPHRVIYVSCDPATLARDLKVLCDQQYILEKIQPFDMFPQTAHVESVALLRSKG